MGKGPGPLLLQAVGGAAVHAAEASFGHYIEGGGPKISKQGDAVGVTMFVAGVGLENGTVAKLAGHALCFDEGGEAQGDEGSEGGECVVAQLRIPGQHELDKKESECHQGCQRGDSQAGDGDHSAATMKMTRFPLTRACIRGGVLFWVWGGNGVHGRIVSQSLIHNNNNCENYCL